MKVIICGAGQVGSQVCQYLSNEDCEMTIVDVDPILTKRVSERFSIRGIAGSASDPAVLQHAEVTDADLLIAVTSSDEVNIVACLVARNLCSGSWNMARLRHRNFHSMTSDWSGRAWPVNEVMTPDRSVAETAVQLLESPSLVSRTNVLANRQDGRVDMEDLQRAYLVGMKLDDNCTLYNTPLRHLAEIFTDLSAIVVGLGRAGRLGIALPDDTLENGDVVYVCVAHESYERTLGLFGKPSVSSKRLIVVGAGNVGMEVVEQMTKGRGGANVRMIESNKSRAESVAERLRNTIVLHGDGLNRDILENAGIGKADAFLSVTEDDRTNLLVASRAKKLSERLAAFSLVNDPFLVPLSDSLGIDAVVDPRNAAMSPVLSRMRGRGISSVEFIADHKAELIEVEIDQSASFVGKALRNADLPEETMVAAIKKNNQLSIPKPDTVIQRGDKVAFFAMVTDIRDLLQCLGENAEGN